MQDDDAVWAWSDVRMRLELAPPGTRDVRPRASIASPELAGATRDVGLPVGQLADWRFPTGPDCTGLHVHEFVDRWEAHIDQVHPACSIVGHLRADAPQVLVGAGLLLGAVAGARVGGASGCIWGALLGGALGVAAAK